MLKNTEEKLIDKVNFDTIWKFFIYTEGTINVFINFIQAQWMDGGVVARRNLR